MSHIEDVYTDIFGHPANLTKITLSYACAISDGDKVILTGGYTTRNKVSVYSMTGFLKHLAKLNVGRQYHACASYIDNYGRKVRY